MQLGLEGKAAIVTGASTGIGLAIARALAAEGASVLISARGGERVAEAGTALAAEFGVPIETVAADMSTAAGCTDVVDAAVRRFGRLDILVNNAGGSSGPGGFMNLADEHWQIAFDL